MVVFDADMVAKPNFFTKILELMLDNEVALALTPQGFNNVDAQSDIFNNLNLSFWEYMLPGTDALGYIACTGTNFCLRCNALADCGWFPTFSITEDYTLGMMLKAKNYKAGYLNEYLAIGEAPEEIRNIFRQRSRWCKGQMQVRQGGLGVGLGEGGTGGVASASQHTCDVAVPAIMEQQLCLYSSIGFQGTVAEPPFSLILTCCSPPHDADQLAPLLPAGAVLPVLPAV
jgi:hypothetical protein